MNGQALAREAAFQDLLGLAVHSFAAYVVESSSPVVVSDADKAMMKLFAEVYEKERHYVGRAFDLVDKSGVRPLPPTFDIRSSNFNFLTPMRLAEYWPVVVAGEVARLEALRGRIAHGDRCAQDYERLLADFIALRREAGQKVADLRSSLAPKVAPTPSAPPKPAA